MRHRKRKDRQMTVVEATQSVAVYLMGLLGGTPPTPKRRRNRGSARRNKTAARNRLYTDETANRGRALARAYNEMVEKARAGTRA